MSNFGETDEGAPELTEQLYALINRQDWEDAAAFVRAHPETVTVPYHRHGWTLLHWICSMGATPASLIDLVASLYPQAIVVPDSYIGDTALNIVGRSCQLSADKMIALLKHCDTATPLIRNRLGGTALHSAANHNAVLPALQALVEKNPAILSVATHEGIHAVTALWLAYTQTIPGMMKVAHILSSGEGRGRQDLMEDDPVWDRFWKKVEYLALQCYWHKQHKRSVANEGRNNQHVTLGLLQCNVPINLLKTCLKRRPETALAIDSATGNRLIHVLIENRPYRLKEREAIAACLGASSETAGFPNAAGDVPLQIGIRNKIPWHNGLDLVVAAAPDAVQRRDTGDTFLFPFQLASQGGKQAVETAYHLLKRRPDLLSFGVGER